jgi:hypothetical protein
MFFIILHTATCIFMHRDLISSPNCQKPYWYLRLIVLLPDQWLAATHRLLRLTHSALLAEVIEPPFPNHQPFPRCSRRQACPEPHLGCLMPVNLEKVKSVPPLTTPWSGQVSLVASRISHLPEYITYSAANYGPCRYNRDHLCQYADTAYH